MPARERKPRKTVNADSLHPIIVPRGETPSKRPDAAADESPPITVALFGSTGSIGMQTLDVLRHLGPPYRVAALVAGQNFDLLTRQAIEFQPQVVGAIFDSRDQLPAVLAGHPNLRPAGQAMAELARDPAIDIIVVATAGHAAIAPTLAALEAGKIVALANKETIVCAGALVVETCQRAHNVIRPIDSEHSALWQSLGVNQQSDIARLILTASGGPFRTTPAAELENVTAAAALHHPTWTMGGKVTIDSATLMNKGLELIEAHWLYGIPYEAIDVVVHPESIIHSLIEFADMSQIAQLSIPDMRLPIQYALTYPRHQPGPCRRLMLSEIGALHFEAPDISRFPSLQLAREAGMRGDTYPTVLSAADEVAVEAFLAGQLRFPQIPYLIETVLDRHSPSGPLSLESIAAADAWARQEARRIIEH